MVVEAKLLSAVVASADEVTLRSNLRKSSSSTLRDSPCSRNPHPRRPRPRSRHSRPLPRHKGSHNTNIVSPHVITSNPYRGCAAPLAWAGASIATIVLAACAPLTRRRLSPEPGICQKQQMQLYVHISGPTLLATVVLLVVVLAELLAVVVAAQESPGAVGVPGVITAVALALLARAVGGAALVVLAWNEWMTFEII